MPTHKKLGYLLTFVDTFSGWIEACPTSRETADPVASLLIQIIPHFDLPATIQSDNGPAFTAQVVQLVAKFLNTSQKLHIPYHPQSSGKVEQAHGILKDHLAKLAIEGTRCRTLPVILGPEDPHPAASLQPGDSIRLPRAQTRILATQESWTEGPTPRTHDLVQVNCQTGGCQSTVSILIPHGKSAELGRNHGFHFQHGLCFLYDQTKDDCHWWNTTYGGCPHSSCVVHKPRPPSRPNHMLSLQQWFVSPQHP
ncbi:uncharacterized protein LOC118144798 [Callithrix jacchus]|uniref:uncharacterized protein LOC118144798 n=1 Tax=Callithrix jacchus TaxID=9483 RepID=UPI0023DD50FB|nr:uncharacterized protein LOC118144798 [Callithrix jacchus]XP_054095370.1 uncharacterized protein LOC118144798 [Callithrix jacchus]